MRVYASEQELFRGQRPNPKKIILDRIGGKPGQYVDFWVHSQEELDYIASWGYTYEVIDHDPWHTLYKSKATYRDWPEVVSFLENIASAYPNIAKLDTIGWSYEGRPVLLLKMSDNPNQDEDEPAALITGLHHAREWPALEVPLFIIDSFARGYGSDPVITQILNNSEVYFIPCVNPDGYYYSYHVYDMWRKNRHYFSQWGTYGVDLNRNYDGGDDGNPRGMWGSVRSSGWTGQASHDPTSDVFSGALSQDLEVKAVVDFFKSEKILAAINYHTYSELVLYPIGYDYIQAPDDTLFSSLANAMASAIGGYTPGQAVDLYPTSGDSDDWMYGWAFYTGGWVCVPFTVEIGTDFHPDPFPDSWLTSNYRGAVYLLQQLDRIAQVVPYPIVAGLQAPDTANSLTFTVSWTVKNPASNPSRFHLQRIDNYQKVIDDVEAAGDWFEASGWSRSTTRAYSGSYSWEAQNSNNANDFLRTTIPYKVEPGDSLVFWLWASTEENYDAFEVAVSENGRDWEFLDCITGSTGGWVRKAYDLSPWVGKWLYFGFLYMTDGYTLGTGVWVDDITVAKGDTITVSDNISGTSYQVTVPSVGTYVFRVKPYNSALGWGDWSQPKEVVVDTSTQVAEGSLGKPLLQARLGRLLFGAPAGARYSLEVYDAGGRLVWSASGAGDGQLSSWTPPKPGVFLVKMSVEGRQLKAKLVSR